MCAYRRRHRLASGGQKSHLQENVLAWSIVSVQPGFLFLLSIELVKVAQGINRALPLSRNLEPLTQGKPKQVRRHLQRIARVFPYQTYPSMWVNTGNTEGDTMRHDRSRIKYNKILRQSYNGHSGATNGLVRTQLDGRASFPHKKRELGYRTSLSRS